MTHRFFVPPESIRGARITFEDAIAHQLRSVLRMRPGERIIALDNAGWEYEVELSEVEKKRAAGTVIEKCAATGEPSLGLTLYQCLLKRDNFEWVLQKCAEIGVSRFVPVISRRTVVTDVKANKAQRWERILTEAAEQSRRGRIPALAEPLEWADALRDTEAADLALIPWEGESARGLRDIEIVNPARVALFIGPEGGFDPDEIALAVEHGAVPVTLGPRILRAETAAVVASALVMHEWSRDNSP